MLHYIITLRDIKTDSYFAPQFVRSKGGYLRQMQDDLAGQSQPNSVLSTMQKHPDQFEIYCDGTWDDSDGKYTVTEPERLAVISDLIA